MYAKQCLADIEQGKRKASLGTYAQVEAGLKWEPGSVKEIMGGGHPLPKQGGGNLTEVVLRSLSDEDLLGELQRRLTERNS